ncbi:hypothetical protein ACFL0K_00280 [Patescibacteria group bacterium]
MNTQPECVGMSPDEIRTIITKAKPGNKLIIVFAKDGLKKPGNAAHFNAVVQMCAPNGNAIDVGPINADSLLCAVEHGIWGHDFFRKYLATILEGFDAKRFIRHTVMCGILQSVQIIK